VTGRGRTLLTRRNLHALNAALGVALVVAVAVMLWYFSSRGFVTRGGDAVAGLRPVLAIAGPGRGQYPEFTRPMDAAFGPQGRIYALDTGSNRVVVFGPTGRYEFEFGGFGAARPFPGYEATWEEGLMNHPVGIDVDEDGTVYVADFRNDQIQVFDSEGAFVRRFPDPGQAAGDGTSAQDRAGIAVTDVAVGNGLVFAAEAHRVVVFTVDGEFVRQFGSAGSGPVEFDGLTGLDVTDDGVVFVADSGNSRIQALSAEGEFLWSVGRPRNEDGESAPVETASPYEFGLPQSIAVMGDGSIAVLDALESTIVLLSRDGQLIGRYGERGSAPGQMGGPSSIYALGDRILVSDTENDRIQVLALVR
jgi:tripartite motif-containing protein 71